MTITGTHEAWTRFADLVGRDLIRSDPFVQLCAGRVRIGRITVEEGLAACVRSSAREPLGAVDGDDDERRPG